MLGSELAYTEHERLALANLQTTLRLQALAHSAIASLAVVQLASGTLATGATLGLCIYEFLASGPQRLLLFSLLRLALLLCVGLVAYKAFGQRVHSFLGIPRPTLCRVAIYLQLLWFSSELLLGSALLAITPLLRGSELSGAQGPAPSSLYSKVVPICYMVAMAGCLCFFTHFRGRRRYGKGGPLSPSSSCNFYDAESVRYAGAATPMGGLRDVQPAVTCEIVLMEHQLDTNESVLFVHKKLRPIKTRPDDGRGGYLPLLKPLIGSKNFVQQQPAAAQPQPQQPQRPAPPAPAAQQQPAAAAAREHPPLINLSSSSSSQSSASSHQSAAAGVQRSGGSSSSSYVSPMERLQQLAAATNPATRPSSFTSTQSLSFSHGFNAVAIAAGGAAHHGGSGSSGSSSGARSVAGLGAS